MNRYRMQAATKWWSPKLNRTMVKLLRFFRHRMQLREQRLMDVTVQGAEMVRELLKEHAVLITPNHPTHADAYSIYAASDAVGVPFYLMTAWQVFADKSLFGRQIIRWHGSFSVDREATDMCVSSGCGNPRETFGTVGDFSRRRGLSLQLASSSFSRRSCRDRSDRSKTCQTPRCLRAMRHVV